VTDRTNRSIELPFFVIDSAPFIREIDMYYETPASLEAQNLPLYATLQSAAPGNFLPQGAVGNIIGALAPQAGAAAGGMFGQGQAGAAVGQAMSALAGLLPFAAGPQNYAPQGAVGNIIGALAPQAGAAAGGMFGQGQAGAAVGQAMSALAGLLPFAAGPQNYAPQGAVGNIIGALAPQAGAVGGGMFGQGQAGAAVGQALGALAGLLPFAAGPQSYAPQGAVGNIVGALAPQAGAAAGGMFGQGQAGAAIGQAISALAGLIPFAAGPQGYAAPYAGRA
jgi:hypothetical protein